LFNPEIGSELKHVSTVVFDIWITFINMNKDKL